MSSQQDVEFNISNFQKQIISLGNVDRTNGEVFPQYEGEYIFIHRADFPVGLKLTSQDGGNTSSFIVRPGDCIKTKFKGLCLTHPLLNVGVGFSKLEFTIGKECAQYVNNDSNPYGAYYPPTALVSDSALGGQFNVYIPYGIRFIQRLVARLNASTITEARYQLFTSGGIAVGGGLVAGYPLNMNSAVNADFISQQATFGTIDIRDIPVTVDTAYIQVTYAGTGMSQGAGVSGKMIAE